MTDSTDLTIFLHMTKTAGGTLREALLRSKKPILFTNSEAEVETVPDSCDFVYGHLKYGLQLPAHRRAKYMTFVRHPFTRVVSHYYQLKHVDLSKRGEQTRGFRGIDHFFERSNHWELSNFMSKILTNTITERLPDDVLFERVKDVIDRDFAYVGIFENFQLSLFMLSHQLGVKLTAKNSYNIGSYDPFNISHRTIETILKRNQVDLRLYQYCNARFLEQTASLQGLVSGHEFPPETVLSRLRAATLK